ncbi:CPBP family intramembrane glutamic endopeptidase [Ancylomarina longa]|uniref:CPBP family intramembrane metalloprotease n=1 Tax=Ancylomarina longa TaxID=2487017 RepID=A0A434AV49_9BACT|nr:CPBP family intramembrane glutamic endopeptidase [Ancylomarina longa]RUT78320.1 CPBP family intramembrane metalloprotease [Ancylomarina longa]
MLKASFSHYSPLSQLVLSLLIILGSFFLTMFAGSVLAYFFFNINILTDTESINILSDAANISALKFYQAIYSTGMFIIPPFILAYLVHNNVFGFLFLNHKTPFLTFVVASVTIIVALPMINFLAEINSHLQLPDFLSGAESWMRTSEDQAKTITEKFLVMNSPLDLLLNLLLIAVIPALGEELLFRGVLQKIFTNMTNNIHWGIVITAFLFAALHMQFFGLLPRMAMGILFGYLLIWTKSLWVPIVAHLMNNGLAVLSAYYIQRGNLPKQMESVGTNDNFWFLGLLSCFLVILLMFGFFWRREI